MGAMDDKPFGETLGDYGLDATGSAMSVSTKFDGPSEESKKFEGEPANPNASASQLGSL
jgi:hypothetical protein